MSKEPIDIQITSALRKFEEKKAEDGKLQYSYNDFRLNAALFFAQGILLIDGQTLEIKLNSCGTDIFLKDSEGNVLAQTLAICKPTIGETLRAGIEEIMIERFK